MFHYGAYRFLPILLLFIPFFSLFAQGSEWSRHQYVIRGEVYIDLEPIYAGHVDEEYPLDIQAASRRALEEASLFFSSMIYGWSFNYEIGERARQIDEVLELEALGSIPFGDPAMRITDTDVRDSRFSLWADYHLNDNLQRRMQVWRSGMIRNAQGTGFAPSHLDEYPGWIAIKKMALEDAARAALRGMLRGSERNRPKEAKGFISLAAFPRFYIDSGRWVASARFRVQLTEIVPFSAY
ncbi:MAG: hypothetical protein FWD28_07170 [Treponema sp.]|nr:hypothetical protein [Treponema sp.]